MIFDRLRELKSDVEDLLKILGLERSPFGIRERIDNWRSPRSVTIKHLNQLASRVESLESKVSSLDMRLQYMRSFTTDNNTLKALLDHLNLEAVHSDTAIRPKRQGKDGQG